METVPWYESAIVRQQIVQILSAAALLLGVNLGGLDITTTVASIFGGITALVGIWTLITRIRKPAPNLSITAAKKEIELVKAGTIPPSPTGPGSVQRGFFRAAFAFVLAGIAAVALALLSACAVNPHKTAQTAEQHGDAVYGELTILKEQGARIIQDATVSDAVKRPIAEAIVAAKPVTDGLQDSLILYTRVKGDVATGANTAERLAVVDRELAGWIAQAQPIISKLAAAIAGATK